MDPSGYDLALAAAMVGARVVLATNGETSARFSLRNGDLLDQLGTWSAAQGDAVVSRVALAARLADFLRAFDLARAPERLRAAGVRVIEGSVAFTSARSIRVGPEELHPRRLVIATGRSAPGMTSIAESLVKWTDPAAIPRDINIHGGGSSAVLLARICQRAGISVVLHLGDALLAQEEPEAVERISVALRRAGITIACGAPAGPVLEAAISSPALAGLALDIGQIETRDGNLVCDAGLRTSNARVFAIGSVVAASERISNGPAQIGPLLGRMLFRRPANMQALPDIRVVSFRPSLAATGMTEHAARATGGSIRILRSPIPNVTGHPQGLLKAIIGEKGRILGVSIVADQAQELIAPWLLAISARLPVEQLGRMVQVPSAAFAATREVGLESARAALAAPRVRAMLRLMRMFG